MATVSQNLEFVDATVVRGEERDVILWGFLRSPRGFCILVNLFHGMLTVGESLGEWNRGGWLRRR